MNFQVQACTRKAEPHEHEVTGHGMDRRWKCLIEEQIEE